MGKKGARCGNFVAATCKNARPKAHTNIVLDSHKNNRHKLLFLLLSAVSEAPREREGAHGDLGLSGS
jgi:hypothetical protein